MSEPAKRWSTAITEVAPSQLRLRGYPLDELTGRIGFVDAIHLTLVGELPSPQERALLDAILVSAIDHGATPPSTLTARTAAGTGAPTNAAIAAGILSINRHHGGAIASSVALLREALDLDTDGGNAATTLVARYLGEGRRLPGYGHRLHGADPRTRRLFELARQTGVAASGVAMADALERELSAQLERHLPINVDGAIAALAIDLDLSPELANSLFLVARVVGLTAHVLEERARERPMRRIDPSVHRYDGPAKRSLPEEV